VSSQPQQVIQNTGDLIEHHTDVLGTKRHLDTQQFLDGHDVTVFVAHHGDIIEPVHVTDALIVGLAFGQLFGGTMQQTDMRIGSLHGFAIQLQHHAQHTVRRWVLGTEV